MCRIPACTRPAPEGELCRWHQAPEDLDLLYIYNRSALDDGWKTWERTDGK